MEEIHEYFAQRKSFCRQCRTEIRKGESVKHEVVGNGRVHLRCYPANARRWAKFYNEQADEIENYLTSKQVDALGVN